jgi:hydrogenase nickel incorporation protein HypA/HybF
VHELSIADAIVRIACTHAAGRQVAKVEVKVGHLRQVVPEALTFAFDLVAVGTPVEGAELAIEEVPAVGRCRACRSVGELPGFPLHCAECGGLDVELLQGEELLVDALELEGALTTNGGTRHGHH